jgi:uncharacterized protein YcbX
MDGHHPLRGVDQLCRIMLVGNDQVSARSIVGKPHYGRLKSPLPMNRFRMNVVLEGLEPFQEDEFQSISTASVSLQRVTAAERCLIVTPIRKPASETNPTCCRP